MIKSRMIHWAKNVGHELPMEKWQKLWIKHITFTLNVYIKENTYKIIYRWHMTPTTLAKIECWKCKKQEGSFYHMWCTCTKTK